MIQPITDLLKLLAILLPLATIVIFILLVKAAFQIRDSSIKSAETLREILDLLRK